MDELVWASHLRRLAFADKASSRAVQLVLQESSAKAKALLAGSFRGYVVEAMKSMYANYVLSKILETMPVAYANFVAEELVQYGPGVARHRFGCRLICRLLEFGSFTNVSTVMLMNQVLDTTESLCRHNYGSYVVGHFLEFGTLDHRHRVAGALLSALIQHAANRNGSRVVEAALIHCSPDDREVLVENLLDKSESLRSLAVHQFGCHVVKALLRVSDDVKRRVWVCILPVLSLLEASNYGRIVIAAAHGTDLDEDVSDLSGS